MRIYIKKYILPVIFILVFVSLTLFFLLKYFNKNVEGLTCNKDDKTKSNYTKIITGDKLNEIQEKCEENAPSQEKCLEKCEYENPNPIKKGEPMEIFGNCGSNLFSDGETNFKFCPPRCMSTEEEQKEENDRRQKGNEKTKCLNDNDCASCVSRIEYDTGGGDYTGWYEDNGEVIAKLNINIVGENNDGNQIDINEVVLLKKNESKASDISGIVNRIVDNKNLSEVGKIKLETELNEKISILGDAVMTEQEYNNYKANTSNRFLSILCGQKTTCPDSTSGDCCGSYEDEVDESIQMGFETDTWHLYGSSSSQEEFNRAVKDGIGSGAGAIDYNYTENNVESPRIDGSVADAQSIRGIGNNNYGNNLLDFPESTSNKPEKEDNHPIDNNGNKIDCSTYPNHPKCRYTNNMYGCIKNAGDDEVNSMVRSNVRALDSSWGVFK